MIGLESRAPRVRADKTDKKLLREYEYLHSCRFTHARHSE